MTKKSFLHPSQRSLRTEQIGPSGHKNEYHVGVLEGNWQEERHTFGPQPSKNCPFTATTTNRTSFQCPSTSELRGARPPEAYSLEAPRQLLFGHGKQFKSSFSLAELCFTNPRNPPSLTSEQVLAAEGTSPRRSRSNSKRREGGVGPYEDDGHSAASQGDESLMEGSQTSNSGSKVLPVGVQVTRDRFTTSKNVTIDATGMFILTHQEVVPDHTTNTKARGKYLKSLNDEMHKTRLRDEFVEKN
jgi:hypothetical protein